MPILRAQVQDPQSAEYVKGQALALRGQPAEALKLFEAARSLDPESATLFAHEANTRLDLNQPAKVVADLTPVLAKWPRHIHLCNLLAVALFQLDHHRAAARLFEHCLSLDDEYHVAAASLKRAKLKFGASKKAPAAVRACLDAVIAQAALTPKQSLAVCMIVKNEAEFIVGAIDSARGLASEIIVVDTGSTDETVALATQAGARVEYFAWTGDFSEARNVSIEHATADWIFILDADERITQQSRSVIRALMEDPSRDLRVICPKIRNLSREGRFLSDGFSGRMFRNDPRLRFEGRVHEEVGRDMRELATDYRLDVVLDHFGADPDVVAEKGKDERNLSLLQARLAERPDDLMTWFYLGSQHWIGRRLPEAAEAFGRVVDLYERDPSRYGMAVIHVPVPYSFVGQLRALADLGQLDRALAVAADGLARFPDNPDLWFHAAYVHLARAEFDTARDFLKRSLAADVAGYSLIGMHDPTIKQWRAEKTLADIEFEHGDRAAAYPLYRALWDQLADDENRIVVAARLVELCAAVGDADSAVELTLRYVTLRPEQFEVAIQMAEWLVGINALQTAYDVLTEVFEIAPDAAKTPEFAAMVGQVAEAAGAPAEALRWYGHVAQLEWPNPRFWLSYARVLIAEGHTTEGTEAMAIARQLMGAQAS